MKDLKGKIGVFHCSEPKLKTDQGKADQGSGSGWIEGYLAVFGNVDQVGDRIIQGAFAKSITERVAAGKVPLLVKHFAYGGDVLDTVGVITEAKEDSYGLWIHANYLADDDSQAIRAKVQAASDGGLAMGLSVGYRTIRYDISNEDGTTIYNLRELELREGTLTVRPCNELAGVTQSKSDGGEDRSALEDKLAALTGVSKSTISRAIDQAQAGAAGKTADPTGPEIAGLDDLEAAINANRIYLEREKIA